MHAGPKLGAALREALALKGVSQRELADEFNVKQPSVSGWVKTGRMDKKHIEHMVVYFGGVVGPEHWGLPRTWGRTLRNEPAPITRLEADLLRQFRRLAAPQKLAVIERMRAAAEALENIRP